MALIPTDIPLGNVEVADPDGNAVRLGDVVDRPTVLIVPRYYGCLPCRGYLKETAARIDDLEAQGASALGVSSGTEVQARWLMAEQGVGFPLYVDPDRNLYDTLELPRKWWVAFHPKGWWNYLRAILKGNRQGRIIEPIQLPGLALLDAGATARLVHRGKALGDYPPVDTVLAELATIDADTA